MPEDGVSPRLLVNAYGEVVGPPLPVDQPRPVAMPPLKSKVVVGSDGGSGGGDGGGGGGADTWPADTPGKKNRTKHRKVHEGKARGCTPLAFGLTTFSGGSLVVCEHVGGRGACKLTA